MYRVGDAVKIKRNHSLANTRGKILAVHGDEYHISLQGNRGLCGGTITLTGYYLQPLEPHEDQVRCVACRRWFAQQETRRLGSMRFCSTCYHHAFISQGVHGGRRGWHNALR